MAKIKVISDGKQEGKANGDVLGEFTNDIIGCMCAVRLAGAWDDQPVIIRPDGTEINSHSFLADIELLIKDAYMDAT